MVEEEEVEEDMVTEEMEEGEVIMVVTVGGDLILVVGEVDLVVVGEAVGEVLMGAGLVIGVLMVAEVVGALGAVVGGGLTEVAAAAEVEVDMVEHQKGTWTILLFRSKILATWSLLRRTFTLRVLL